jgi:hypothetical protein
MELIGKIIGYVAILIISSAAMYNLGYFNGRYDLVREPTRKEYVQMGWGFDEAEMAPNPVGSGSCAPHLDGNGSACGPRCRPNCFKTDWLRGVKFGDLHR